MIKITTTLYISRKELEETFTRSPGPGGQHVNKVATGVQLRFDARNSTSISPSMLRRLRFLAGRKITNNGVLIITSHRHRTQSQNRSAALERLVKLLRQTAKPQKIRRSTTPSKASQERRLTSKKRHSETKKNRSRVNYTPKGSF